MPCRKYVRTVLRGLTDTRIGEEGHKNMIICSENDLHVARENQNKFISEFYGKIDNLFTEMNLIMCQNVDTDDIRVQLREHKKNEDFVKVDNLFVFYTNNDRINSFEKSSLERWNTAYSLGVKNCFIFAFSGPRGVSEEV